MADKPIVSGPQLHDCKVHAEYYSDIESGKKPFELRKDDRPGGYQVGDYLKLREWDKVTRTYTGRACVKEVTYKLEHAVEFGLATGYCILGLRDPLQLIENPATAYVRGYLNKNAGAFAPIHRTL